MVSYEHKVKNIYLGGIIKGVGHIPSKTEFDTVTNIIYNNFTQYTERSIFMNKLHIPLAGELSYSSGNHVNDGNFCLYWTSTVSDTGAYLIQCTTSQNTSVVNEIRGKGASVRLFIDEYIEPDNTRTVEIGTLGSAGIFHNADLGVVSITNGTNKNITMYDKNVGATTVWNNGDALTSENCGKFFQRGNYYGFKYSGATTTSSTKVNTTGYGGNNPYSSSTFIKINGDRSSVQNDNLRADSKEEYFVIE